jgi:glycosyltransferase involved in cell wall biosynthesis
LRRHAGIFINRVQIRLKAQQLNAMPLSEKPDNRKCPTASITWARTVPRSRGIARALAAQDFYIEYLKRAPRFLLPLRYLLQTIKTVAVLLRARPRLIIATNPPILVPLIAYAVSRFTRARFIIDSHTGAFTGRWGRLISLHRFLSRRALATLVTNEGLRTQVASWGAAGLVLEDRLPELPVQARAQRNDHFSVAVINSFSDDEPLDAILAAASGLADCRFFITGRAPRGFARRLEQAPPNVTFTGFLPYADYVALLNRVDTVMVLVTTDLTLLCGAYEAVSVEKPLITSDWPVLKNYFCRGALYVDNSPEAIREAVKRSASCGAQLRSEMRELKSALERQWSERFDAVRAHIYASL